MRPLPATKGVIVRTSADAIPQQSRAATGVRLQKLDKGDRLLKVVLVPPEAESDEEEADAEASEATLVGERDSLHWGEVNARKDLCGDQGCYHPVILASVQRIDAATVNLKCSCF